MTNEHAINVIKDIKNYYNDKSEYHEDGYIGFDKEDNEAIDLAIKALEAQSNRCDSCTHSKEQDGSNCYECVKGMADNFEAQPCEDCISRQAVIDLTWDWESFTNITRHDGLSTLKEMRTKIEDLPSVTPTSEEDIHREREQAYMLGYEDASKKFRTEPCEDCISKEAVIKNIKWWFDKIELNPDILIDSMITLPPVTPRRDLAETSQDCISRQAVLDVINFEDKWLFDANGHNANTHIAFSGLESRVKALPSVTPSNADTREAYIKGYDYGVKDWFKSKTQPCEDAVSRSELLSHDFIITAQNGISHRVIYATRVEEAPPVIPQRKIGKWVEVDDEMPIAYSCSECNSTVNRKYNYCPECGAYMRGEEDV